MTTWRQFENKVKLNKRLWQLKELQEIILYKKNYLYASDEKKFYLLASYEAQGSWKVNYTWEDFQNQWFLILADCARQLNITIRLSYFKPPVWLLKSGIEVKRIVRPTAHELLVLMGDQS